MGMTYGKRILRNESDWQKWLTEAFVDVFGHEEDLGREDMRKNQQPDSFPVAIVWKATQARYNWFYFEFVYPKDFEG